MKDFLVEYFKAFWTLETLPFLLALLVAWLTFRYDRAEAETNEKRKKAAVMFLTGGLLTTLLALIVFGRAQLEAAKADERSEALRGEVDLAANELSIATNQLTETSNQLSTVLAQLKKASVENKALAAVNLAAHQRTLQALSTMTNSWALLKSQTNDPCTAYASIIIAVQQATEPFTNSDDAQIRSAAISLLSDLEAFRANVPPTNLIGMVIGAPARTNAVSRPEKNDAATGKGRDLSGQAPVTSTNRPDTVTGFRVVNP